MGAKSFHADRWTDTTELIVYFRNFANAPKNGRRKETRDKQQQTYRHDYWPVIYPKDGRRFKYLQNCGTYEPNNTE